MMNSKLVVLAVSFLVASPNVGFAAGASGARVGYGGTGIATRDTVGESIVGIPDMAIGGPAALDVTRDLPSTAPQKVPQMTPHTAPSPGSVPAQ